MTVQGRAEHSLIARAACPRGVPAAVPETRLMADEHLVGAEPVADGAADRRLGDPLPVGGLDELPLVHVLAYGGGSGQGPEPVCGGAGSWGGGPASSSSVLGSVAAVTPGGIRHDHPFRCAAT
jgi:hypothetical protein